MTQPQKLPSNKRIAHQKKAQAGFSLVGGTLGLAALASRGKASQLTNAAKKTTANGPKLLNQAAKWKDRSTALTTAGAGVGGVGAYNFASYTNADAKRQQKMKKNHDPFEIHKKRDYNDEKAVAAGVGTAAGLASVPKAAAAGSAARKASYHQAWEDHNRGKGWKNHTRPPASATLKAGLKGKAVGAKNIGLAAAGGALVGAAATHAYKRVKKSDPFEIEKLGSPKVRYQEIIGYTDSGNKTTRHDADTVESHYKGKSLILRRPKYQLVGYPSSLKKKPADRISYTPNYKATKDTAKKVDHAYKTKAKKLDLGGSNGPAKHVIGKSETTSAFGIDHGY